MKKIAIIASILAAVSFVSCNKELTPEVKAPEAANTITLNLGAETRTTYSGNTTTWNADDSISVFICEHGTQASATWKNYKFTCKDAAAGTFTAEVAGLSETEDYDVYAFYPYFSGFAKPDSVAFNISYNQKITGIDGKSGKRFQPLWAAQTTGQKINALGASMQHVATYFKFNITANDDITISSITMTAPEGVYLGTSVVVNAFDGSFTDGKYTKNSVSSTVTGGVIEAGETGSFTMLVRPFALTSGQKLQCVLATSDGQKMTIELTAPAAGYNFEAGKVNKVNRTFTAEAEAAKTLPYEEAFASSIGDFTTKDITLPTGVTYVWKWASANYGVKGSAYVSNTAYAAESWLVSPALDLTKESKAYLSFDFAMNNGTPASYADNFYLMIIEGSNETKVSVPNIPSSGSWTFISVKDLDLSAYCGKTIKIAFVYKSTTTACPTIEVKNVKVANEASSGGDTPTTPTSDYSYTFDLSKDNTATATTTSMTWNSTYATIAAAKASSGTDTNNYYPGAVDDKGNNYSSTRFYKKSTLTITPTSSYKIVAVVFSTTTSGYGTALASSTWTNATAKSVANANGATVTVTPTDGTSAVSATLGGTTGCTSIVVYCNAR